MKIIKRDGSEVPYDYRKIQNAIEAANAEVAEEDRLSDTEVGFIVGRIERRCADLGRSVGVEEIQDMVIDELDRSEHYRLARHYSDYRLRHELLRKQNSTDARILALLRHDNELAKQENANKDPIINSTMRDYLASEVSEDICRRYIFPEDVVKAHDEGIIHIHDMGYVSGPISNCELVNLEDMLQNGTVITDTLIEKPHSFSTACNIATQIIAQVASNTYGGQTISLAHPCSATFVFDYNEYVALERPEWSSLHVNFAVKKSALRGLKSLENVVLKVRVEGLGENKHDGETTAFSYYVNAVGSWSRIVNPACHVNIQIGTENSIPITEQQIQNVLDDAAGGELFYIPVIMSCFNRPVIADMGRIQFTLSIADATRVNVDGYTIFADSARSALTANLAGSAVHADEAGHAETADYAGAAGSAVIADNFFITTPDVLLNVEEKRFSPGMDTADIPTAPVVNLVVGQQCVPDWHSKKTTNGIHQTYEMVMGLNNTSSQVQNQGYQKNIGNSLSLETILQRFIDGYRDFYIVTVEDCEKYPEGTTTGSYSQTYLLATYIIAENKSDSLCSRRPILTRELGSGKKMYLWKCTVDAEKAQTHLNGMADGTRRLYWNGIWHTRRCETEETKYWTVYWYWLDYAFTDGSYTDEDMMNFFITKYMYWGSNVNHLLLDQKFKEMDELNGRVEELGANVETLEADVDALKELVPIPEPTPEPVKPKIVCWGDSLTAGGGWTTTLANLCGGTVYNGGTGGENARTIMARQGGDCMTINHITIPATCEPVTIAVRATDGGIMTEAGKKVTPLLQGGAHVNPVMIGDVEGTLRWTGSSYSDQTGIWTFTRSEPGEEVVIDRPTAIRTNFDRIHNSADEIMVIFIGQNGGYNGIDDLIDMHRKMIDHFKGKEYVILGLSSGTAAQRADYEAAMKNAFGRRFISLREYLAAPIYDGEGHIVSCYGLADQGLEPGTKEYNGTTYVALDEIAAGTVPHQIITDSVHYTAGTKTVIGKMLYKKMKELNIL